MEKNVLSLFSGTDVEGISALIAQMEKSPFDYLRLEGDGIKLVISKNGATEEAEAHALKPSAPTLSQPAVIVQPQPTADTMSAVQMTIASSPTDTALLSPMKEAVAKQPGVFIIKSPSYGMFYAQPDPSSPPYVTVGCNVKKGDTIGLLEIMKVYTSVSSEVDGEVLAIHVKNEDLIEPGQALVSVRVQ